MSKPIYIQKAPKRKDAFRLNSIEDVPETIRDAEGAVSEMSRDEVAQYVKQERENIRDAITAGKDPKDFESKRAVLDAVEKHGALRFDCTEYASGEVVPLDGRVIGFEKTDKTQSGYNMWCINDESRIIEKDGVIYAKPTPTPAEPMGANPPDFLAGAPIKSQPDGSYTIQTDWGESSGKPGEAYWVKYGTKSNGTPDANILTKSEKSFSDYYLCTEDGTNVCPLPEFDAAYEAAKTKDPDLKAGDFVDKFIGDKIEKSMGNAHSVAFDIDEPTFDEPSVSDDTIDY